MFDAFASVVLMVPAALFGRRRGGDRHGEVTGGPVTWDEGADAFSAFEDLVADEASELDADGAPDCHDADAEGAADGAPGWVVGDTSLDGPAGADEGIDHGSVAPDEELWHPAPGDLARLEPLAPFEEQIAATGSASDVWGPIAIEPMAVANGDRSAPFRLNRLKKVAGPVDDAGSGSVAVAPGSSLATGTWSNGGTATSARFGTPESAGQLIRGPVGRSRGRTTGRHIRRPLPIGPTGDDRGGLDADGGIDETHHLAEPDGPRALAPTVDVDAPAGPVPVFVAADGVVATGSGSVRVARPEDASASSGQDGLVVQLQDHWCWAALDEFGPDLTVRAGSTVLRVPAGTTALLSIDDDGAQLVVVLDGEGVVDHDGTKIRLRSGAMAYLPVEGDPQVDVAADDEIRSDPLVARNLQLDRA